MNKDHLKPLASLLLIFIAAPLLAALVSPWVYTTIQQCSPAVMEWVHECEAAGTHTFWADIADSVFTAPFRRVNARIVLIMTLILLRPAYQMSGFRSRDTLGISRRTDWLKLIVTGMIFAILSMLLVYILGMVLGVYKWDLDGQRGSEIVAGLLKLLLGGLFIGILEEILFRGFIFNALRKGLGLIAGVLLSSSLFAVIHFIKPGNPDVTDQWYSGFLLFRNMFAGAGDTVLQQVCTLFSMGAVLAMISYWTRSVYLAIGLHAGWVWVMMFFRLCTENQENLPWLYGTSDWLPNSWMGPIMALIVLIVVALTRKKWIALGHFPSN